MRICRSERWRLWSLVTGLGLVSLAPAPCQAQILHWLRRDCPSAHCPAAEPQVTPLPPTAPAPGAPERPEGAPSVDLGPLTSGAGLALTGATTSVAPNMIGHLLLASRSVDFRYNRAAGPINVADNGSTSITNPSVADNNSPIPQDRVSFRFNYFDNAQQVTGFGPAVFDAQGVGTAFARTREYSSLRYTFSVEKTFLDGWGSVELRAPFSTGLSSDLNLSAGDITSSGTGPAFGVTSTPDRTLGSDGTQFENMTLIFKGLTCRSSCLAVSAGLAIGIPTGDDTSVRIVDYSGSTTQGLATIQRERVIHIDNETWSLSPFVAALYTPSDRFFAQGFLQFDLPLNDSTINYSDVLTRGTAPSVALLGQAGLLRFPSLDPPFAVRSGISEQPLLQLDLGAGYWLLREPCATWITGIAPTLEMHYTTTLKDASIATLPGDSLLQIDPNNPRRLIQEEPPRVGNLRNRVDILDLTVGATFEVGNNLTVATAFAFPLRGGDNKTFDWEFLLEINYYFGASRNRTRTPGF